MANQPHHNVYVVELDKAVMEDNRFLARFPTLQPGKRCFYVGMTGLSPKERFERHKAGHQASRLVRIYGKYLRTKLFKRYNPMTYEEAKRREKQLAETLIKKGHNAYYN